MKNICFISGDISRSGGTERVGLLIANYLVSRGYNVSILSIWRGEKTFFFCNPQIKKYTLIQNWLEKKLHRFKFISILKYHYFIKKNKFDFIIDIDTILANLSTYAIRGTKCKLISWEHFNYLETIKDSQRIKALKKIERHSCQLVVLTRKDLNLHLTKTKLKKDRITQIYNPISFTPSRKIDINKKRVITLGNFIPDKGYDLLLKIWSIVEKNISTDWYLEIVGSGKEEKKLKDLKEDLKLTRVIFSPKTQNVEHKYLQSSIYVLSSRNEGFPMVLLEACAMGLPIIAFNCNTGPDEIIEDGLNGFLIEPFDITLFAQKLIELITNKSLREKFSKKSIEIAQKFQIDKIGNEWESLLNHL